MLNRWIHIIFFGNIFYGLAAVLLAMETVANLGLSILPPAFYLALAAATILFYTASYQYDNHPPLAGNLRAKWVHQHSHALRRGQVVLMITVAGCVLQLLWAYGSGFRVLEVWTWGLALGVPLVAFAYYGLSFPGVFRFSLRRLGFAKPFIIGLVWMGATTLYPILMDALLRSKPAAISWSWVWYAGHNLMFITTLCILFDIKDYAADHNADLKTFVVQHGLRVTLFQIVLPLVLLGILSFAAFWLARPIHSKGWWLNLLPMAGLLAVTFGLQRRRSILYYLLVIDGLMVVKALAGLLAAGV